MLYVILSEVSVILSEAKNLGLTVILSAEFVILNEEPVILSTAKNLGYTVILNEVKNLFNRVEIE